MCDIMDDLEVVNEVYFDILQWWKVNSLRFLILSHMTRDVLAVSISTMTSESTFSTSGRILDAFRSSLTPIILQSLVCTEDWLHSTNLISVEENLEILNQLEEGKKLLYALQLHFRFSSIVIIFIINLYLQNFQRLYWMAQHQVMTEERFCAR
jgi:hAT family C-terminal dimerisation region